MGVVYMAWQVNLKRLVALKMLPRGFGADSQEQARFRLEAEAVARLQHPHIVQIFEIGEQEGRSFLALEFADGGTLAKKLKSQPLPPVEAARLIECLARAIHHAHQRGIIHRDLKPSNVLLLADGRPKISDFGLAKHLEGPGVTQSGPAILGTPSYMAPEQAEGKSRQVSPATDIYALGATLYEMLTGRVPFREDSPLETMLKVVQEEPLPPSRACPGLPRDLETICLKCLRKKPGQRYASAEALADDLGRFLRGEPIHARPPGPWERTARWLRRHREKAALTMGALAVAGLLVVAFWRPPQPDPAPAKPPAPRELPADLALVPQHGLGHVSLNVAGILARQGLIQLSQQLAKIIPLVPSLDKFAADLEKEVGFPPSAVERFTIVFQESVTAPPKEGPQNPLPADASLVRWFLGDPWTQAGILSLVRPVDRAKVLACFPGPPREKMHQGRQYLTFPDAKAPALAFISDRILVLAPDEARLQRFLERIPAGDKAGPLEESLVLAQKHPCVVALNPPLWVRQEWADALKVPALRDVETATLTIDWLLRTAVGDGVKFDLHLAFADEKRTEAGLQAVEAARTDLLGTLKGSRKTLQAIPGFAGLDQALVKLVGELEFGVQAAEVQRQGTTVYIQVRVRFDIPEWFKVLRDATAQAQAAAARTQTLNNLRQLCQALLVYEKTNGRLPPAAIRDGDGKPLLSWRVALLPYLDQKKLFDQFKLDEPWDGPHNRKLLARMPTVFVPLRGEATVPFGTFLQAVVGPGAAFEGKEGLRPDRDFPDGLNQTILLVEAARAVPWTKPEDVVFDPEPLLARVGALAKERVPVVLADGLSWNLSRTTSEKDFRALITRNGKEKVDVKKLLLD